MTIPEIAEVVFTSPEDIKDEFDSIYAELKAPNLKFERIMINQVANLIDIIMNCQVLDSAEFVKQVLIMGIMIGKRMDS